MVDTDSMNESIATIQPEESRVVDTRKPVIRILIADDHPIVRDGLRKLLSLEDDFEVVGEANDGREVLDRRTGRTVASEATERRRRRSIAARRTASRCRATTTRMVLLSLTAVGNPNNSFRHHAVGLEGA